MEPCPLGVFGVSGVEFWVQLLDSSASAWNS
jgi:hypothetical protein